MDLFNVLVLVFGVAFVAWVAIRHVTRERKQLAEMSPAERAQYFEWKKNRDLSAEYGPINSVMVCPHCQKLGEVRTKPVDRKKGVSGEKAAAAVITAGLSVMATGLSRTEQLTQAYCGNCGNTWDF
jgi:hypothetical protein